MSILLILGMILSLGTLLISISALKALPRFLQILITLNPILSFGFNMLLSTILTSIIGAGMISGVGNMLGSILFALWSIPYGHKLRREARR